MHVTDSVTRIYVYICTYKTTPLYTLQRVLTTAPYIETRRTLIQFVRYTCRTLPLPPKRSCMSSFPSLSACNRLGPISLCVAHRTSQDSAAPPACLPRNPMSVGRSRSLKRPAFWSDSDLQRRPKLSATCLAMLHAAAAGFAAAAARSVNEDEWRKGFYFVSFRIVVRLPSVALSTSASARVCVYGDMHRRRDSISVLKLCAHIQLHSSDVVAPGGKKDRRQRMDQRVDVYTWLWQCVPVI